MKLRKLRYCAYFCPHCNQSEPQQQEPSLPTSSCWLQLKTMKIQAAGSTKTVTIYRLAHYHIVEKLFVTGDVLSEDVMAKVV